MNTQRLRRPAVTKNLYIGLAGAIALGVALLLQIISANSKTGAASNACRSNLTTIYHFICEFQNKYGHIPPASIKDKDGKPMHSWRVLLLEFSDKEFFDQYDMKEAWDGPRNRVLAGRMPRFYACPNDPDAKNQSMTSYAALAGPGTAFPDFEFVTLEGIRKETPKVLLLIEARSAGIHWMEPRDVPVADIEKGTELKSLLVGHLDPGGPAVLASDMTIFRLNNRASPDLVRKMATIARANRVDWSPHNGSFP